MNTNNLKYFAAVAEYGSITQAAKAMYISQPQLSHIIQKLEEETGLTLFRRTSQGTMLTRDGERILAHCQIILRELDSLDSLVNAAKVENSRLNVCMTRFSHTAECFNEISRRYEDIDSFSSRLFETSAINVVSEVKEGRSQVGVLHYSTRNTTARQDFEEQGLDYLPLATFRPYVCLAENHELIRRYGRRGLDIKLLRDYGFVRYIGQYEDFIYYIATEEGLVDLNATRKVVYVNDRQEQMRLIAMTNFFTTGILEFMDQNSMYGVISVPLLGCQEDLQFGVLTRKGAQLSRMEVEFIQLLRLHYEKLYQQQPKL